MTKVNVIKKLARLIDLKVAKWAFYERSRSAYRAAWNPDIPWTPAPGGAEAEHRNTRSPIRYGLGAKRGRISSCRTLNAPPAMSPPT